MFIYSNLLNLVNLVYLNLIFSYKKFFLKRKVVIFFHPKQRQTKENVFFIKDCFEKKVNQKIDYIFLHQDIYFKERNHFYTKERRIYSLELLIVLDLGLPKHLILIYILRLLVVESQELF